MHPNFTISHFPHAHTSKPDSALTLVDVVDRIRTPAPDVKKLNGLICTEPDKAKRRRLKEGLPAVTFGARFEISRQTTAPYSPSGLTVVDVDDLDHAVAAELRSRTLPGCSTAFLSPSGRGVKFVVKLDPTPATPDEHTQATVAVMNAYAAVLNLKVDPSGKDVTRLCFLPHDPELVVHQDVKPFTWRPSVKAAPAQRQQRSTRARVTLENALEAFPFLRPMGGRHRGAPCPICGGGIDDAFWVQEGAVDLLFGCNQCAPSSGLEFTSKVTSEVRQRLRDPRAQSAGFRGANGRPRAHNRRTGDTDSDSPITSEDALARRYIALHGKDRRFLPERKVWMRWLDTVGWTPDPGAYVTRELQGLGHHEFVRMTPDGPKRDPKTGGRWATAIGATNGVANHESILTRTADWDAVPDLIGLPGGRLLEVCNQELVERARSRDDLVSRSLAATPRPKWENSRWADHLLTLFDDPELLTLLQRAAAMALVGRGADEQRILMAFGPQGTGKSSTCNAIRRAFGDYGSTVDPSAIVANRGIQHPTNRTAFIGRRFVTCAEIPPGHTLDTSFVKALSGNDPVRARGIRENEIEHVFRGLLLIHTNHEPDLLGPADGIKRRLLVLPFTRPRDGGGVRGWERAIDLSDVVGWILEGAKDYLRDGLGEIPAAVATASESYHEAADDVSAFVAEHLRLSSTARTPNQAVYARYEEYCRGVGIARPLKQRALFTRLREGGFGIVAERSNGVRWLAGCELQKDSEAPRKRQ